MNKIITHLPAGDKLGSQIPEIIVLHAMGEIILTKPKQHAVEYLAHAVPDPLSAHSLIAPDGTNYRCREDTECAYHAAGYNVNSLGLEALVEGEHDYSSFLERIKTPYLTDIQYVAIVEQCKEWLDLWPIKKIVTHNFLSPERKVDPGEGFPLSQLLNDLRMN